MKSSALKRKRDGTSACKTPHVSSDINCGSFIKCFELIPHHLLAIVVHPDVKTVALKGIAKVKPLHGEFTILGYHMTVDHDFSTIYSFPPTSFLSLSFDCKHLKNNLEDNLEWKKTLRRLVRNALATLLVRNVNEECASLIQSFIDGAFYGCHVLLAQPVLLPHSLTYTFNNYPKLQEMCLNSKSNVMDPTKYGFVIETNLDDCITIPDSYYTVSDAVIEEFKKSNSRSVIVISGGKNTGKSTFSRYLINRLLSCGEEQGVLYFEGDPGQTEFTPPGTVSLHYVNKPIFGPPFTQQASSKVLTQCFLGVLTVQDASTRYEQCTKYVMSKFQEDFSQKYPNCPIVVNTMGWNTGLGPILLSNLMVHLHATCLITLQNKCLAVKEKSSINQEGSEMKSSGVKQLEHKEYSVISDCSGVRLGGYSASDEREITLTSYLSSLQPLDYAAIPINHLSHCLFSISFEDVFVAVCHHDESIDYHHFLYVANCSFVALSVMDKSHAKVLRKKSSPLNIIQPPVSECLGFGFVRYIDMDHMMFVIATSLSSSLLEHVNVLLFGDIGIPQRLIHSQSTHSIMPYATDYKTSIIGSRSIVGRAYQNPKDK